MPNSETPNPLSSVLKGAKDLVKDKFLFYNKDTKEYELRDVKEIVKDLRANIESIVKNSQSWPQVVKGVGANSPGFLPPILVTPTKDFITGVKYDKTGEFTTTNKLVSKKYGEYEYTDWRGYKIKPGGLETVPDTNTTDDRFKEGTTLPRTNYKSLRDKPYSTRDHYLLFNDTRTDYFKHGLQIIDNLGLIEDNKSQNSKMRLDQFQQTPFENNDPVMFGFEIIIDDGSSPLLNGSVHDFLKIYSGVDEIKYKIPVYEDFKEQFKKLFRTKTTLKDAQNVDTSLAFNDKQASISKSKANYANTDSSKNIFRGGKPAYLSYYLKKVGGLGALIESNTSDKKKYLTEYRTDVITLDFNEDVSLTMGTLAHLYKLLYWSKPNGKSLVPENLLRFNCDIIVSECRNFNRVRKALKNGDLEVVKDNLSRYIYSLKECQLFFNTMPHSDIVDMSAIATYDTYTIQFDYKYSSVKFERFMPSANFGKYVGYDGGAIWKIGNPGARTQRGTQSTNNDISLPRFFTSGTNTNNENGVKSPLILNRFGSVSEDVTQMVEDAKLPSFKKPDIVSDADVEGPPSIDDSKGANSKSSAEAKELANLEKEIKDGAEITNAPKEDHMSQLKKINFKEVVKAIDSSNVKNKLLSELTKKGSGASAKNFIEKLKDKTIKSVKQELATLVNGRVNLLSRTINKLLIDFVGKKGISPPQNVYKSDQGALGNALSNVSDRFFYDIRNELADFAGGSISDVLNSGISNLTKK